MKFVQKFVSAGLLGCVLVVSTVGCKAQDTTVQVLQVLGNASAQLAKLEGKTAESDQIVKDTAAVVAAVKGWKPGTKVDTIRYLVSVLEQDLNLLPVPDSAKALVFLALGALDQILALFPTADQPAITPTSIVYRVSFSAAVDRGYRAHPELKHRMAVPIRDAKDFRDRWNDIVAEHPDLAGAHLA